MKEDKYKEFRNWQPVNEWEIVIENVESSGVEELKLNYTSIL